MEEKRRANQGKQVVLQPARKLFLQEEEWSSKRASRLFCVGAVIRIILRSFVFSIFLDARAASHLNNLEVNSTILTPADRHGHWLLVQSSVPAE